MSGDAIAVFHPTDPEKLKPFLDLDEESEESEGLYAEALGDGTFLVHTFQPFDIFEQNPAEMRTWLEQFGDALEDIHDDPRGLLFFPDTLEPASTTYDAVIAELADKGIFCAMHLVDDEEGDLAAMEGIDMDALQGLAAQLLGGAGAGGEPGKAPSSFDIGQLFGNVQQQLAEALGMSPQEPGKSGLEEGGSEESPVVDEEFAPEPIDEKKKKS